MMLRPRRLTACRTSSSAGAPPEAQPALHTRIGASEARSGNSGTRDCQLSLFLAAGVRLAEQGDRAVAGRRSALPLRTRRTLALRFGQDLSQSKIADIVGLSQMHVSRLLGRAIADLRNAVPVDE